MNEAAKSVDVNPENLTEADYRRIVRDFENGILWAANGWQLILESAVQKLKDDALKSGGTRFPHGVQKGGKR